MPSIVEDGPPEGGRAAPQGFFRLVEALPVLRGHGRAQRRKADYAFPDAIGNVAGPPDAETHLRQQIANVSHDLRTPLTSILGYLQLLEGEGLSPEKKGEYLAVIEGRARTLQTFIAAFYDLSRIEGGELPLEREQVDLRRALSDQLAASYGQIEEAGLDMEVELADGLPPVWADSGAVTRIFSNLLTNALRHGKDALSVRLYRAGNVIVSAFSNRAEGLTAEDAAHVFERFYTADKMRTGQSTGLGLAIVKALAERMGHTTAARWEDGVFTIEVRWVI